MKRISSRSVVSSRSKYVPIATLAVVAFGLALALAKEDPSTNRKKGGAEANPLVWHADLYEAHALAAKHQQALFVVFT